jgi:MFS family permease
MLATLAPLTALFSGVALLLLGSGLLATLLGVRGTLEGYSDQALGLITSAYFLGFLLGTFMAPAVIRRMGHIRAFPFFGALFACSVLAHAIWVQPFAWGFFRFGTGIAVVGLYTVIESWMNATVDGAQRGRVFAVYTGINLVALALGQQLLRLSPADSFVLFSLVAMLICAAMLPVTATRIAQPVMQPPKRIGVRQLFGLAPAAAAGALFSGLTVGTFWGLGPVYAGRLGFSVGDVATFMTITILGGALLQWPIGRFSDSGDRRRTLAFACVGAASAAAAAAFIPGIGTLPLYVVFFLYGGLSFAVYPVAVAHLLDYVAPEDLLPACSTVLLLHGVGAALGPSLAGFAMGQFGPQAFPGYLAIAHLVVGAYVVARLFVRRRDPQGEAHFHPMLRTSPAAMEMLPEADSAHEGASGAGNAAASPGATSRPA